MGSTKVLLDTNILISALGWDGKPNIIFQQCLNNKIELVTSAEQMDELQRVITYPKFCFTLDEKELFPALIFQIARIVKIKKEITIIKDDPNDNIILETAICGNADYLVTGDPHLLRLKEFAGVKIVLPDEFLKRTNSTIS